MTTKLRRFWPYIAVIATCLFTWGWMPFVEVSKLSASAFTGRLIAAIGYILIIGICSSLASLVFRWLRHRYLGWSRPGWQYLMMVFFVWAFSEWAISWLVAMIWYGKGGSIDTVLPFTSLTPFIMYTPLGFLARLLGYHGLSALVVTVFVAGFAIKLRRYLMPLLGISLIGIGVSWLVYNPANGPSVKAVVIAEDLAKQVPRLQTDADLVVFPEYGFDDIDQANISQRIESINSKEVFFVGSKLQAGGIYEENVLVIGSTQRGFDEMSSKTRLIPGGEYLPFAVEVPLRLFRADAMLQKFDLTRTIAKGSEATRPYAAKEGVVIGAEACASIITPKDYRLLTKQGATVLVNSASLEIFRSPIFDAQHRGLARFMAVANARPFLQSANSGNAFILDHNGRILEQINPINYKVSEFKTNSKATPYQLLGEWPVYIGGIILLTFCIIKFYRYHC